MFEYISAAKIGNRNERQCTKRLHTNQILKQPCTNGPNDVIPIHPILVRLMDITTVVIWLLSLRFTLRWRCDCSLCPLVELVENESSCDIDIEWCRSITVLRNEDKVIAEWFLSGAQSRSLKATTKPERLIGSYCVLFNNYTVRSYYTIIHRSDITLPHCPAWRRCNHERAIPQQISHRPLSLSQPGECSRHRDISCNPQVWEILW
jgi:hypothetical protein